MTFTLEPGPIGVIDATALQPFPAAPSFEGIVARGLEGAAGVDAGLAGARGTAGGEGPPDLDAAYQSTVGVAREVLAGQAGAETDPTAGVLADRTDGAEAYRQEVLPHVPPPSTPIEGTYVEPPAPPKTDPPFEPPGGRGV